VALEVERKGKNPTSHQGTQELLQHVYDVLVNLVVEMREAQGDQL
jgi:hypothetical protein